MCGEILKFTLNLELNLLNIDNYYISVKPLPNSARINESLTISYSHILNAEVLQYLGTNPLIIEVWKRVGDTVSRIHDELLGLSRVPVNKLWNV